MSTHRPRLVLLAALDRNSAIGKNNALPWHLPDDLKRFKALTLGKPLLMGRKTAQSLGRALPGRVNLVLTRSRQAPFGGMRAVASIDEAMHAVADADGRPIRFFMTAGQVSDYTGAAALLSSLSSGLAPGRPGL